MVTKLRGAIKRCEKYKQCKHAATKKIDTIIKCRLTHMQIIIETNSDEKSHNTIA